MRKAQFVIPIILITLLLLSACANTETPAAPTETSSPTVTETFTPDPCSQANITVAVAQVDQIMQEFRDSSQIAQVTPVNQILPAITDLQRIRREAQNQSVPSCLINLKTYQLDHMNAVINTMLAFASNPSPNSPAIQQGSALARQYDNQYTIEMAKLLGWTVIPVTFTPTPAVTPTP